MREQKLNVLQLVVACVVSSSLLCRTQEASDCDYTYLLQPPSELPCNPYQQNLLTGEYHYSVILQCAIAQYKTTSKDDSKIRWLQLALDSSEKHVVIEEDDLYYELLFSSTTAGDFVIHRSELEISNLPGPTNTHMYWCELHTPDVALQSNYSDVFANRVTVYGLDFYSSFPPCPRDFPLHLAESVCVNTNFSQSDRPSVGPCSSSNASCSDTNTTDNGNNSSESNDDTLDTVVIVGAAAAAVIFVLLGVMCTLVVCLCLIRRNSSDKHRGPEWGSHTENNGTPPTTTIPPPEQISAAVVSDRHPRPSIPSNVVPQNPNSPPPPLQTLTRPISAQKRAASLLRQLQRPRKCVDRKYTIAAKREFYSDDSQNEQGPPQRKKPYKSLELNTVDRPHLYMTRAKSPMHAVNKPPPRPRKPPPILHNHPRTVSRERLLLTQTSSNGYIIPSSRKEGEEEELHEAYQEIEAETQDYLALYTVPRHRSPSTSSEEQPIYEEPRPN